MSLELLFDEAPCGLAMADAQGRLTLVNRALVELTGLTQDELLGRRVTTLFSLAGQMYFETHLDPLLRLQGFLREIALDVRRPDGVLLPVLFNATVQRDALGQVLTRSYTLLDARERRGFERELIAARKEAEAASKARADFISYLSHEVRTPLQGLLGLTELVDGAANAKERELHLEVVRRSAENLLSLVNDLLDFGKADAGKLVLERTPFDLPAEVQGVLALLRPKAARRGLTVSCDLALDVPTTVVGDVVKLRQLLMNLVGNGLKFTERGGVTVRVFRGPNGGVGFVVRDTGIGLSKEQLPLLFEAITQASADTARRFGGTGLGLAICRQLVELHGGRLEVDSEQGVGTEFRFELPYADAASTSPQRESPATPGQGRVLVAEDNPVNALLVRRTLERLGVAHEVVSDGEAAVERVRAGGVSVALLDLQMPRLDGEAALRAIRALPGPAARTSLVAFSATVDAHERQALLRLGFDECLAKPLNEAALRAVLRALLTG
ncbi:MAG: ATP-binding protein [Myxococcaceae bacterium]|nr:ATP-binding protein [Myxococcaceae bacterium]